MRTILLFLALSLFAQAGTFRISRALDQPAVGTEAMRFTKSGYTLIYHVEAKAIVTEKDIKTAKLVPEQKGTLAIEFKPEGAKKLAAATKGAAGNLRLAMLVDNELVSVPLVQTELGGKVWLTGLNGLEQEELTELAEALMQGGKADEDGEEQAE